MALVRYIVSDMDRCVEFYRSCLGFSIEKHNPGKFAEPKLEDLYLFLNFRAPARQEEIPSPAAGADS